MIVRVDDTEVLTVEYDDGTTRWVPRDEANPDYRAVLEWIAAGNPVTAP